MKKIRYIKFSKFFITCHTNDICIDAEVSEKQIIFFFFFDFNVNFIYLIPSGLHTFQINFKQHISAVMGL